MEWEAKRRCESLSPKSAEIVCLGEGRSVEGGGQNWTEGDENPVGMHAGKSKSCSVLPALRVPVPGLCSGPKKQRMGVLPFLWHNWNLMLFTFRTDVFG